MADEDSTIQGYTDGVFWERNTLAEQIANTGAADTRKEGIVVQETS